MFHLGMDLGGTKIEGAVLDSKLNILSRTRIFTEQEKGYEHILSKIGSLYHQLVASIQSAEHSLGIGTPGTISHQTGCLKNSNTVCLNGRLSRDELRQVLNHDFTLENDANCFALAESVLGAAQNHPVVFGVIMGTGCGGGIVIDGQILKGKQAIAGEWGHMSVDPQGPLCYCGMRGCVETLISGGGLEKLYFEKYGTHMKLTDIVKAFRSHEPKAKDFMTDFFNRFGRALANVINVLDPDIVVLGGGVSNIDELYTLGVESVQKHVFSDSLETAVVKNKLGDSSGVLGAALLGRSLKP